ncbi:vesicle-associated membrane protein 714-like isoform X1 [Mustela putorius furo]|uniref:Vesicle-associated membrane protein 7 n=2 Tax=Mustela putorius furo TaxID=9669 RepID=A0A8U0RUL8_MUSPF|nr:vesicle-associated membrane protein 714-like isoform X1 [Mustela putorius furo]
MTITYSCVANGRAVLAELALTGGSYQVPRVRTSAAAAPASSREAPAGPAPHGDAGPHVRRPAVGVGGARGPQAAMAAPRGRSGGGASPEAVATVLKLVLLRAEPKTIMQMGSFVYHTLFIDGITYLCATDNALDTITPSAFLKNVSDTFLRNPLMSQEHFSPSNAVAADFQQVLGKYMMKYNKNQDNTPISTLRSQVTDVKNIMSQNIDEILESENRLSIFTDRTNDLQTTAKESQNTSKALRRMWWKHFRKVIIITVALLLSIIIILLSTKVIPT